MALLKCLRKTTGSDNHWVDLAPESLPVELQALDLFRLKLNAALAELGRLDCRLKTATGALRADLKDTHDQLHKSVSDLMEADIQAAMEQMVDAIRRARDLTDGVLANAGKQQ